MSESKSASLNARRRRRSVVTGLIFFVFFLGLSVFLESHDQMELSHGSCDTASEEEKPPFYDWAYSVFLSHKKSNDLVRVVAIKAVDDVSQVNLCDGREYMADLVTVIKDMKPAMIVIDKYFGAGACGENAATGGLRKAIALAGVPVIVGESTGFVSKKTEEKLREAKQPEACLETKPQLPFDGDVHYGLLRLNANKEQIPLRWPVVLAKPNPGAPASSALVPLLSIDGSPVGTGSSLSFTAAMQYAAAHRDFKKQRELQSLANDARQPYAKILKEDTDKEDTNKEGVSKKRTSESSSDVLCASKTDEMRSRWNLCRPGGEACATEAGTQASGPPKTVCPVRPTKLDFRDKVVVIGAENEVDHWVVLGGRQWGYDLQAQYIDALLAGSYLRRASSDLVLYLFLAYLILLEAVPLGTSWLHLHHHWKIPVVFRKHVFWVWRCALVFFVGLLLGFYLSGYLPPIQMLFGVALAAATRYIIAGSTSAEHEVLPEEGG